MDWPEKRRYPRFRAADSALAASRDDPLALTDLSAGGFGVRFYAYHPLPDEISLDLFFLDRDFTVTGVRCRKVFEKVNLPKEPGRMPERCAGLEMIDPAPKTLEKIREFRWIENDQGKNH
jgi:hypothetical protein